MVNTEIECKTIFAHQHAHLYFLVILLAEQQEDVAVRRRSPWRRRRLKLLHLITTVSPATCTTPQEVVLENPSALTPFEAANCLHHGRFLQEDKRTLAHQLRHSQPTNKR